MSTDPTKTIPAYWDPKTGDLATAHEIGTDEDGDRLYQLCEGFEPVTDYWLDEDGYAHASDSKANRTFRAAVVGDLALTTEEQAHLPVDELIDAALANAAPANVEIDRGEIRIVAFTLQPAERTETIRALQTEAAAAGDTEMVELCERAFQGTHGLAPRHSVADAINDDYTHEMAECHRRAMSHAAAWTWPPNVRAAQGVVEYTGAEGLDDAQVDVYARDRPRYRTRSMGNGWSVWLTSDGEVCDDQEQPRANARGS